jgi:hypothetical protein
MLALSASKGCPRVGTAFIQIARFRAGFFRENVNYFNWIDVLAHGLLLGRRSLHLVASPF